VQERRFEPAGRRVVGDIAASTIPRGQSGPPSRRERAAAFVRVWTELFSRHQILNSASAISFQSLKTLVPLALFGIALLSTLGLGEVWTNTLASSASERLTGPSFRAVDAAARKILQDRGLGLPFLAGAALLWYSSGLVRACMNGMNLIYEADEQRSFVRRWATSFALALCLAVAVVLSVLVVTAGPRIAGKGAPHVILMILRWPFAVVALGVAVALLVHFGPAKSQQARWTSAGSILVVGGWMVESLLFGWYVRTLADFTSASGTLTLFLVLAAYLYTASIIFLVGVQLDELLRKDASESETGILGLLLHGRRPDRS
jgi:membrane protein